VGQKEKPGSGGGGGDKGPDLQKDNPERPENGISAAKENQRKHINKSRSEEAKKLMD